MNRNKKGQANGVILFFLILGVILVLGIVIGIGAYYYKQIVPPVLDSFKSVGNIDDNTNVTYITEISGDQYITIGNNFTWMTGFFYFIVLIGSLGFALYLKGSENKTMIFLYIGLMLLLILLSILMSNSYENIYTAGDDLADYLHTLPLLSFLVLNSPIFFSVIGLISGIIMMGGSSDDDAY